MAWYKPVKKTRPAPWVRAFPNQVQKPRTKARAPLARKRIPTQSVKRRKEQPIYNRMAKAFLIAHPWCVVYPQRPATEVHHSAGRKGSNYLDMSTWLPVSKEGHDRIHYVLPGYENLSGPKWAVRQGYLKSFIV